MMTSRGGTKVKGHTSTKNILVCGGLTEAGEDVLTQSQGHLCCGTCQLQLWLFQ